MAATAEKRKSGRTAKLEAKAAQKAAETEQKTGKRVFTAATADRHVLYQLSVQNVEAEIDFVDDTYEKLRGRKGVRLREDYCGTGNTSCEWVRRRDDTVAVGLDIDQETLDWGEKHNLAPLDPSQRERVTLHNRDVMHPGDATGFDIVLAMNFSYWLWRERNQLVAYFKTVHESLADDGLFFLDHYGGYEAHEEMEEDRKIEGDETHTAFTYVWDQHKYNPITGEMECRIHFKFKDKTRLRDAFIYTWRLWGLAEIQDCLRDAGFSKVSVYWEGDELDDDGEATGEGSGEFTATREGDADAAYVSYLVAEK